MKRILLSTVTLGLVAGAFGCVNLDEKLITGVSSQYYSTPDGLNSAVIASYASCAASTAASSSCRSRRSGPTPGWRPTSRARTTRTSIATAADSTAPSRRSPTRGIPRIRRSTRSTRRSIAARRATGISAGGRRTALLGEAHFLRALNYFTLVQTVRRRDAQRCTRTRASWRAPSAIRQSEVYKAIIADLDTAVTHLPVAQADFGRATKGAAQTLRSKVYLTRAYQAYSPSKQADFQAALADAKAVINSGTYSLEPVFADLWCVARPADPGRTGYCENTGYNRNHKEFIFTVQFAVRLSRHYDDAGDEYNYLHLVYLGQYDNNGIWVGTPRDLNNGRPFRRVMPTPYELSLWNKWVGHAGRERHSRHALRRQLPDGLDRDRRATSAIPRATCPACTSNGAVNVGDTAAFMPQLPGHERVPPEQAVQDSDALPDRSGRRRRPRRRTAATATTRTTATSTGSAFRRSRSSRTTFAPTSPRRKAARSKSSSASARCT